MSIDYKELTTTKFCAKKSDFLKLKHRRKREKDIRTWIRNRTSNVDCGLQITDKNGVHPIHCNSNNDVLRTYQLWRNGYRSYLDRVTNKNFDSHFLKEETFYYTGAHGDRYPLTLVNIDIDCKKTGTLTGAMEFAEFLRQNVFPEMYYEVSTKGKGAHGYVVLEKGECGSDFINRLLLDRLQPYLRKILNENDFDVENVEIKGTCPVFKWGEGKLNLIDYTAGVPAKIPRLEFPDDEQALRDTTHICVNDLLKLPILDRSASRSANNIAPLSLSSTGVPIKQEDLDDFDQYLEVANELLSTKLIRTSGKQVVKAIDVAIFLMLGKCFTNDMNKDGTMPRDRFMSVWQQLSRNGFLDRAYCGKRFKVVRDFITSLGLIDWQDRTFRASTVFNENGKGKDGKACKWKFSEDLMELLNFCERDKGKEESILGGTNLFPVKISVSDWIEIIKEDHQTSDITIPKQTFDDFDYQSLVDEIITCWPEQQLAA